MSQFSGQWSFEALPAQTLAVFGGRLDDRRELIAACGGHPGASARSTDAELALCAYEVFGLDVGARLRGDFALAVCDPRERRVLLARDAIGVKPLYYQRRGQSLLFAADITSLLSRPAVEVKPNDAQLAELMVGQLHRQDADGTTLFAGIFEVPPAHVAIFSASTSVVCRYWDFTGAPANTRTSAAEYAEAFRFHFERAVARRVRGDRPTAVAVSGGLDSSAILCVASACAPAAYPPIGVTYTHGDGSEADESRYIGDLENFSGREIRRIDPQAADRWMEEAAPLIRRVEAPMIARDSHLHDRLLGIARESGAGAILTGHWGDQMLFEQAYLIDLLHRGAWRTLASHLREYPAWFPGEDSRYFRRRLLLDVLQYDVPQALRRPMRTIRRAWTHSPDWLDWYTPSFRARTGPDEFSRDLPGAPSTMARALYREVRSRYHGLCLEWHAKMAAAHGMDAGFPFFDRDLIEFLMSVPGDMLTRGGVPKAIMRDGLAGLMPDAILARRTKGDFTRFANEASRRDHARMVEFLGRNPLVVQAGYVDADKLKSGLQSAGRELEGSASSAGSRNLTAVFALETWLREFFGNACGRQETRP